MVEEFDTAQPVVAGQPEQFIGTIVADFLAAGEGRQGPVGEAASVLVDAAAINAFAVRWLEARYG